MSTGRTRWILDDGPLGDLADFCPKDFAMACPGGLLLVAPATYKAAHTYPPTATVKPGPKEILLGLKRDRKPLIDVIRIMFPSDDPASVMFRQLHSNEDSTTHRAEREAIAWATVHAHDAILVTRDKRAALTALAEMGPAGRVAHPFDLWLHLLDLGVVSAEVFEQLCHRTKNCDQGLERMPDRVATLFPG